MNNISDLAEHLAQCAEYAFAYKDREELERVLTEYFDSTFKFCKHCGTANRLEWKNESKRGNKNNR